MNLKTRESAKEGKIQDTKISHFTGIFYPLFMVLKYESL